MCIRDRDQDALDEAPDRADGAAAEHKQDDLPDALFVVAQIEVMDAEPPEKDAQQPGGKPAFLPHGPPACGGLPLGVGQRRAAAVSYTHLDVYKRQRYRRR